LGCLYKGHQAIHKAIFLLVLFTPFGMRGKKRTADAVPFFVLISASLDYLSSSAATPGSVFPSRNSRDAPPPVEMWDILSARPL
jgi:hypothetical protein